MPRGDAATRRDAFGLALRPSALTDDRAGLIGAFALVPSASAFVTDFDGSLAPIVVDPESARPVPGAVEALRHLAERLAAVAVVSGRPAAFLLERIGPPGPLRLYGLYGLERVRPDGTIEQTTEKKLSPETVGRLAAQVRAAVPGALVEEKGASLALHWRTRPDDAAPLMSVAERLASEHHLLRREGRSSVELLVAGAPDKGSPVRELGSGMGCVAYAGDDRGDVAAFDALDELAQHGTRVFKIAVDSDEAPGELLERADLVCGGPSELVRLIEELAG